MSVFRPSNVNKRLVGTATTISGSPGNGGQLGPKKLPYFAGPSIVLGSRFIFGCCGGVFKANESRCGRIENCQCATVDCGGFFICCGPSTTKWFVAPSCTQVLRSWYNREDAVGVASACMGSCGWFVPTCGQLQNPGFSCRIYWDGCCSFTPGGAIFGISKDYWSSTAINGAQSWRVDFQTGGSTIRGDIEQPYAGNYNNVFSGQIRAFRCTAT